MLRLLMGLGWWYRLLAYVVINCKVIWIVYGYYFKWAMFENDIYMNIYDLIGL